MPRLTLTVMTLTLALFLSMAYAELDRARANGFDGTVEWTKAAGLLTAAKIQQQFGKYPNCIDKVRRARYYIHRAQAPH
jgi:hypothetical protein